MPPQAIVTSSDGECPARGVTDDSSSSMALREHYVELRPLELRGMSRGGKSSNPLVSIEAVPEPSTWGAEWLDRIRALTPVDLVGAGLPV